MPTDDDELDDAPETAEKGFGEEPVDPEEVGRWRRFARRFMDRKELAEDTRDLLTAFLSTSDKAKSELVRMAGREVRHYLDGLRLKEDLLDVATNYRLEVHATFHLEPIAKAMKGSSKAEPKAQVKGEVRPNAASKARDDGAADEEDDEGLMASSFRNQLGCGLVIVTGAVLLGVMAIMASNVDLRPTTRVSVLMEDAVGVGAKADVMVAGVKVGRVAGVEVDHDRAKLMLDLYDSAGLRNDVRVRMRAKSVLGEKYVELLPESTTAPLLKDGDSLVPGGPHTEIDEMVNALGPLIESFQPEQLNEAMASVGEALDEDPERLARILRNADEALQNAAVASRELPAAVTETRQTLARANRAIGTLEARASEAQGVIDRANRVLEKLDAASEPLPELVDEAEAALADVRAVVGPMTHATEDLSTILANFRDVDEETLRRLLREDGVRVHLFGDGRKKKEER